MLKAVKVRCKVIVYSYLAEGRAKRPDSKPRKAEHLSYDLCFCGGYAVDVLSVNAPDLQKLNSVFLHGFDLPSKVGSGFVCESYKSKSHGIISKLFY